MHSASRRLTLAAVATLAFATSLASAQNSVQKSTATTLTAKAIEGYKATFAAKTGLTADDVVTAPLPGFVEVDVGTTVYYMDVAGKWLLDGHVVDLATKTSVTAARKLALEQASQPPMDWKALNLNDAIKTVRGSPTPGRVLVTFEDPNCVFCKKLTPELEKMDNVTVFNFPVAVLGPNSQVKNEAIWCSKDRGAQWAVAMKGGAPKGEGTCDLTGLARNAELAQKLKVTGTPTLFFADGSRVPGYIDAAAIEARLAAVKR
jgi:thiol:disulfide interchange protein DsbC